MPVVQLCLLLKMYGASDNVDHGLLAAQVLYTRRMAKNCEIKINGVIKIKGDVIQW